MAAKEAHPESLFLAMNVSAYVSFTDQDQLSTLQWFDSSDMGYKSWQ